jgi:hypothetical protein
MALVGLKKKSSNCKICLSFKDDILNEITLDILFNRRTYKEIMLHYTPMLPDNLAALNAMNINNHRKHSDPQLIAEDVLKRAGKSSNPADIISKLYSERFKEKIDKQAVLQETYKERLNNLYFLQTFVNEKQSLLTIMKAENKDENKVMIEELEGKITEDVIQIDDILESLQNVVIKDQNSDKGIAESGHTYNITQNIVMNLQNNLKGFLDEIIPRTLLDYFSTNPERGKEFVIFLTQAMDRHLQPTMLSAERIDSIPKRLN